MNVYKLVILSLHLTVMTFCSALQETFLSYEIKCHNYYYYYFKSCGKNKTKLAHFCLRVKGTFNCTLYITIAFFPSLLQKSLIVTLYLISLMQTLVSGLCKALGVL